MTTAKHPEPIEQHYPVKYLAERLDLDPKVIRRILREKRSGGWTGIVEIGQDSSPLKRRYSTMRVAESAVRRLLREWEAA